ncbi:MAG: rubrerythrin family protein [Methanomassiliicoccales archaeon]
MGSTEDNLKDAFSGESQASQKYRSFAERAEEEGKPQVAKLFRAASAGEMVHARCHLRSMKGVGTTEENLTEAIEGENYEYTEMYPKFVEAAKEEGHKDARLCFNYAMRVEKMHEGHYQRALEAVQSDEDLQETRYFVCQVCGNLEEEAPEKCPVCGNPKEMFSEIE